MNVRKRNYRTLPVRCLLLCFLVGWAATAFAKRPTTYYRDIQPLIYKNCVSCHRKGQSAPFPLVTYNDLLTHASMIKAVIGTGYMPPCKADTAYRKFIDQRILSNDEIQTISAWIDNGAPAGDAKDAITATNLRSNLGAPDLVLTAPKKFTV